MKAPRRKSSKRATPKRSKTFVVFKLRRSQLIGAAIIASSGLIAFAASVPNTFTSGSPAVAADVNANFAALATALTAAESNIAALQTKLASVSNLTVNGQPTVRFSGVNVQVVNGQGSTTTSNGTGNLIVGYDEADTSGANRCSLGTNPSNGTQLNASNCVANGGTLSTTGFKTGSHYLVVGSQNNYSRWGGIVAGYQNFSNYNYASVSAGSSNTASGIYANVSGGISNTASGQYASVTGGFNNTASNSVSSVTGGAANTANAYAASVTGGANNTGSGQWSSVSGGFSNTASSTDSSVSGGQGCAVSGNFAWDVGGTTAGCSNNVTQ